MINYDNHKWLFVSVGVCVCLYYFVINISLVFNIKSEHTCRKNADEEKGRAR